MKVVVVYESWVARYFLLPGYSTITIFFFILTKLSGLTAKILNHEKTHVKQWLELMILGLAIVCIGLGVKIGLNTFKTANLLFFLLPIFFFYIWYVIEWFIKLFFFGSSAYRNISFEREAYSNQEDDSYLKNRKVFAFLKYL